ncbi:MAG TPA: hypothetical protein VGM91_06395 [Conexibacter sp.]
MILAITLGVVVLGGLAGMVYLTAGAREALKTQVSGVLRGNPAEPGSIHRVPARDAVSISGTPDSDPAQRARRGEAEARRARLEHSSRPSLSVAEPSESRPDRPAT